MLNHRLIFAKTGVYLLLFSITLLMLPVSQVSAAGAKRERTLVIGKVSSNPKKHYRYLKPIAEYVVDQMHDLGVDRVKIRMAKSNRQMVRYLKQGKIDWITETVFSALQFEEKAGAEMLLLKHKKGVPVYHTVFFTRNDSGIKTIQDLKGKIIAFEDSGSSTGFFIPAATILDAGLKLVKLKSVREPAPTEAVGYVFAKEEINLSTWVHKEIVSAGAYTNLDWNKEDHNPTAFKNNMHLFHQTDDFPRAIEIVRKNLRPEIKERLRAILLNAHNDPDAASALQAYQKTTRFAEIDEQILKGINHARSIMKTLKDKLEF